jgi:hypothetical protein
MAWHGTQDSAILPQAVAALKIFKSSVLKKICYLIPYWELLPIFAKTLRLEGNCEEGFERFLGDTSGL